MNIYPRQIGWSDKNNLLWRISKQLERLIQVASKTGTATTTTTSTTSTSTTHTTTSTTTTSPSDIRLKRNIILTGGKVGRLDEYTWEWNDVAISLNLNSFLTRGVIAQEASFIYPEAVSLGKDGYFRVDYSKIV